MPSMGRAASPSDTKPHQVATADMYSTPCKVPEGNSFSNSEWTGTPLAVTHLGSNGSTEADILPSRPAGWQSAARKRGPGGRAAAPALRAGAQRPGRREHGAMLEWSGRLRPSHQTPSLSAAHQALDGR